MKNFGVTGDPILHSLSPKLFKAAYGGEFNYLRLMAKSADEALRLFHDLNLSGMNITAPFKDITLWGKGAQSREVEQLGMTNTIIKKGDRLEFYNTDTDGVRFKLTDVQGVRCVVLGAGGAGRAAAYILREMGAEVTIANRTVSRAEKTGFPFCGLDAIPDAAIYVNTLHIKTVNLKENQKLIDAIYHRSPYEENFATGMDWLIGQAISAYRLFTGQEPNIEAMFNIDPSLPSTVRFVGERCEEITKLFPPELISDDGMEIWLYDGTTDYFDTAWAVIDTREKTNNQIYEEIYSSL